jgi:3-hydroxymyristoyl/3-hydroxydecanoyl-(acyl carrier protein) dehydratase
MIMKVWNRRIEDIEEQQKKHKERVKNIKRGWLFEAHFPEDQLLDYAPSCPYDAS